MHQKGKGVCVCVCMRARILGGLVIWVLLICAWAASGRWIVECYYGTHTDYTHMVHTCMWIVQYNSLYIHQIKVHLQYYISNIHLLSRIQNTAVVSHLFLNMVLCVTLYSLMHSDKIPKCLWLILAKYPILKTNFNITEKKLTFHWTRLFK